MRVLEVRGDDLALVETLGVERLVHTRLVEKVRPGDYLMVHAGYAIEKIEPEEAEESLRLWEELLAREGAETDAP
jgi:hydrogenase expression/formation protein HypC